MPPLPERATVIHLRRRAPVVAIMAERGDRHAQAIARHLRMAGASVRRMRLQDCAFNSTLAGGIDLPGLRGALPDAVLVRAIAAGSFEQITRRLGILHALRDAGTCVWNDARTIERCVDKSTTSHILAAAGLPTPPTWSIEGHAAATHLVAREATSAPLVLKPLFGAQGRGLKLIFTPDDLPPAGEIGGVYHLQRFVGDVAASSYADYRLFVLRGQLLAAMERRADGWITNVKQGGAPVALDPRNEVRALALAAADAVGADFCGVDILPGPEGPVVLEVNSMPAWSGLQKVAKPRISAAIAHALLYALGEGRFRSSAV